MQAASGPVPVCRAVHTDQVLAEKVAPTEGFSGKDVRGGVVIPDQGADVELQSGETAELFDDGFRCEAKKFGYVCLRLEQIEVIEPLWVAPDRSVAYFLNLPQGPNPVYPEAEEMQQLLDSAGVVHGFDENHWIGLLEELSRGLRSDIMIPVATSTPPQAGHDAEFEWAVTLDASTAGTIMEDGSIDFRERKLIAAVEEGDLLGVLHRAKPGVPGVDVMGGTISAPQPTNVEVVADQRIYAATTEGGTEYRAASNGGVTHDFDYRRGRLRRHRRPRLGITPISIINGDVDYSTGNIDFTGNVIINGSVMPLFSVKTTGSVSIGGYVEAGAAISAGGDVVVGGGIVGVNTTVVAGGSVLAKFIQEADIRAANDVRVGAYAFNATIRTQGTLEVLGRGEGKARALVGGLAWARDRMVLKSVGSPYNTGTRLVAGIDPDQANRLDQLRANMASVESRQQRLMDQLGVEELDIALLRRRLSDTESPHTKKAIILAIKKIARLTELRRDLEVEIEELLAFQRDLSHQASIEVQNSLFNGVEVRIGQESMRVPQDSNGVRLKLAETIDGEPVTINSLS